MRKGVNHCDQRLHLQVEVPEAGAALRERRDARVADPPPAREVQPLEPRAAGRERGGAAVGDAGGPVVVAPGSWGS